MGISYRAVGSKTDTSSLTISTAVTGIYNYMTDLIVVNSSSTNTIAVVTSNTTAIGYVPAPAGGGAIPVNFKVPLKSDVSKALRINSSVAVSTVYITACGFTDTK